MCVTVVHSTVTRNHDCAPSRSNMKQRHTKIGLAAFLPAYARTLLFGLDGSPVRLSFNRLVAIFVITPYCFLLNGIHWVGFLLDELFFSGYRSVDIRSPLFVVGPPRCGTTLIQRVLARDTERFTSFTLGELLYAPSITERYVYAFLGAVDGLFGGPVKRWIRAAGARYFRSINQRHEIGVFEPEEDFILFAHIFANPLLIAMFPFPKLLGHLWSFDRETDPHQRERVMRFYRRCIQRHLYWHGQDKTFLSKNPHLTPMIRSLFETFPDARFVCNVRTPIESLPSMLGFWDVFYVYFRNDPRHYLAHEFVVDYMGDFYRYVAECLDELPDERTALVPYDRLTSDLRQCITELYRQFGYDMTEEFDESLREAAEQARTYRSEMKTGLERYGLDENAVRSRYRDIFDRFEFDGPRLANAR